MVSGGLSPHADTDTAARSASATSSIDDVRAAAPSRRPTRSASTPIPGVGPDEDYVADVRVYLGKIQNVMQALRRRLATPVGDRVRRLDHRRPGLRAQRRRAMRWPSSTTLLRRVPAASSWRSSTASSRHPALGGREGGFGVVSKNLAPKPAYCALIAARGAARELLSPPVADREQVARRRPRAPRPRGCRARRPRSR